MINGLEFGTIFPFPSTFQRTPQQQWFRIWLFTTINDVFEQN